MTDAEMDALAAAQGGASKTLTDADMDAMASGGGEAPPAPPTRSFLQRAGDSISGGVSAVKHTLGTLVHQAGQRAAGAFGLEHEAPPTQEQGAAQIRELTRGVDDVVTLGHGQRLAARIGDALGDTPETSLGKTEAHDASLAPQFRTAGQAFGTALPNPLGEAAGVVGKAAGAAAERFLPGVVATAEKTASHVPGVIAEPIKKVASYEAVAPATAALSADAEGHRLGAAHAAAVDPAGLLISAASGVIPAAAKGAGHTIKSYIDRAPSAEAEQLLGGVAAGEGMHGRATVKAAKQLTAAEDNALAVLRNDKELRAVSDKPAKQSLPVFEKRLDEVGSKLDPHYDVITKATGGESLQNIANVLDDEAARLAKTPLNEKYVEAVKGLKRSILKAWAPGMEEELAAQKRLVDMGLTPHKEIPDVMVPQKDLRQVVTRLQKRGTDVINALNPGEASQLKADLASTMKNILDARLDAAAETSPEVAHAVNSIRELNKQYNGIAAMANAIEQRGWKEATGGMSAGGHVQKLIEHGGAAAALPMALHGNIPGALAAVAAPHLLPVRRELSRAVVGGAANVTRSPGYPEAVRRLAEVARSATNVADFVAQASRAGLGVAAARRIYEAAHPSQGASP